MLPRILCTLLALASSTPFQTRASALAKAHPAVPDYEVKFCLDPEKVLDDEGRPTDAVAVDLKLKGKNTKLQMQFLDTGDCRLHEAGWDVRIRRIEGRDRTELAYKRRFRVGMDGLDATLDRAAGEGFDAGEGDYESQVEWGRDRQVVSFTRKKELDLPGLAEMELPDQATSREIAAHEIPGKLDRSIRDGSAPRILRGAHVYGPAKGKRWSGRWSGTDVDLEVWEVLKEDGNGTEPIVELSFKEKDRGAAASRRNELLAHLRREDWLLPQDVLKTELILRRYRMR